MIESQKIENHNRKLYGHRYFHFIISYEIFMIKYIGRGFLRLDLSFYQKDAITLAQDLLGKLLIREIDGEKIMAKIVETEAYMGPEDKAAHSYNNKRTERTEVMFGRAGRAYIYLIYGKYYCLNIVAALENIPQAVLIRAVEPVKGVEIIKKNRPIKSQKIQDLTNGPGKLCDALKIDKSFNGTDLVYENQLYILDHPQNFKIQSSKRINIDYAQEYKDKLWRFYIKENSFVSK